MPSCLMKPAEWILENLLDRAKRKAAELFQRRGGLE
jgi:hypothetical protein